MRANSATQLSAVLMDFAAAACQDPMGPSEPQPELAPATPAPMRYNASVVLSRIDIEGACDGKDLFGDARKGQFAYKIVVRDNAARDNDATYTRQSDDYGKALGQTFLRGPGQSIDLKDYTYRFEGLRSSESVSVFLSAIEWDLVVGDSDMDGISARYKKSYPGKDGTQHFELNLGSGSCKVELEYSITWTTQ
jgi:hypothetical protein